MDVERTKERGRLRIPAVTCPRCGWLPAFRVTEAAVDMMRSRPVMECVGTYKCQRRGCGTVYDLTVGAYLNAR